MSKHHGRTNRKIPLAIQAALLGIVGTVIVTLISIIGPVVVGAIKKSSALPSPTPACISAADILVTYQILENDEVIAEPASGETVLLDPDLMVDFKPEIISVSGSILPELECKWTNANIFPTGGKLLHNAGCIMVDYQSGHTYIKDAVAMQLSQPSCPALAPYPLFIMPKP